MLRSSRLLGRTERRGRRWAAGSAAPGCLSRPARPRMRRRGGPASGTLQFSVGVNRSTDLQAGVAPQRAARPSTHAGLLAGGQRPCPHSALRPPAMALSTLRHLSATTLIPASASRRSTSGCLCAGAGLLGGARSPSGRPACARELAQQQEARRQQGCRCPRPPSPRPDAALQPHAVGLELQDVLHVLRDILRPAQQHQGER